MKRWFFLGAMVKTTDGMAQTSTTHQVMGSNLIVVIYFYKQNIVHIKKDFFFYFVESLYTTFSIYSFLIVIANNPFVNSFIFLKQYLALKK